MRYVLSLLLLPVAVASSCDSSENPALVAHRGASHTAPENTIPAFKLAFEEGAEFVEGDFWLTKDEQIVCIHDRTTGRTTGGEAGEGIDVTEATLAELKKLDFGAWKDPKFSGARIPTLEEVLAVIPKGRGVYIETKDARPRFVERLKEILAASTLKRQQLVVIAFDPNIIKAVKAQLPDVTAHWLYWWKRDTNTRELSDTAEDILRVAQSIGADGLDINNFESVDADFVWRVREAGLEFHVYTINDVEAARRYLELGVDTITTDRPGGLREDLRAR